MYPQNIHKLKDFARSDNRWMRRASAVSLIIPARKVKFLNDVLEIANILLQDNDDLVQKGYGWMFKAASEANQNKIFDYATNVIKICHRKNAKRFENQSYGEIIFD